MHSASPNTHVMRRRWLASLAGLALLVCAAPAARSAPPAAPGDGPYRVQMVHRTGKSLAPFRMVLRASNHSEYAMWFALELVRERGRWTQRVGTGFGGYTEGGAAVVPTVYGPPEAAALPRCPAAPTCDTAFPITDARAFTVKPLPTSRYYVVSSHTDLRVELDSTQWRVKDVPSPGVRRVFGHTAKATGARVWGTTAEHFTAASAPGGRYGSAVFANVPCERTGQGNARLTGRGAITDGDGDPPQALRCGLTSQYSYEFAYTPYPTTWRLEGDVVGIGVAVTRLLVFDFPKP